MEELEIARLVQRLLLAQFIAHEEIMSEHGADHVRTAAHVGLHVDLGPVVEDVGGLGQVGGEHGRWRPVVRKDEQCVHDAGCDDDEDADDVADRRASGTI